MSFVFYDTETTGLNKGFDQIIQFAAIKTDANLNEVDSFEVRSRLLPHVIPHPKALCTNGITIEQLNDRALMSHYDMVREILGRLLEWSPAIFVGYNSIDFDEEMLRHALIQTLHLPYLTSNHGNGRADAMGLAMAAAAITPGSLVVPVGPDGRQRFRLAELAPANEISHFGAHDAMADAIAALEICRLVRERSPDQWNQFQRFSRKATVQDFVETEDGFVFTEFFGNEAYHAPVVCVGRHPENPNGRLCLRLDGEIDRFVGMSNEELLAEVSMKPSPIRVVRVNAAPTLTTMYEASEGRWGWRVG